MASTRLLYAFLAFHPLAGCATAEPDRRLATPEVASSEAATSAYLRRIAQLDRSGPALRSIIALNPRAQEQARQRDQEREAGRVRGPIHGLPIVIKDNIETSDPMPTTAGSTALLQNFAVADAPLVTRLRTAGAVIVGKANLDQWSNIRSPNAIGGWSSVGGQTRNPHQLDRSPSGSSGGSAVAVAAELAAAAIGTDTGGSLTSPAAVNGIVALRPTLGLVSRTGVVPVASSQDSPGPMARSVKIVANLLSVMAGSDPADPATREADQRREDYAGRLSSASLAGKRLGVMRFALAPFDPEVLHLFQSALEELKAAGAEIVEVTDYQTPTELGPAAGLTAITEFKEEIDAYLSSTPRQVPVRSLADLIAYNDSNSAVELALFGQEYFAFSQTTRGKQDAAYLQARATSRRLAGPEGLDAILQRHRLHALIAPTRNPAPPIGPRVPGPEASVSQLPAIAGYPHLTVPMGLVRGLPVGLSFIGTAWSDGDLLALGHAYEARTAAIRSPSFSPGAIARR